MFISRGVTDKAERKKSLSSGLALMKGAVSQNAFQILERLRLEDLAARLGMTREAFLDALPLGEDIVLLPLLPAAAAAEDAALCATLIGRLSSPRALVTLWIHCPDGLDASDHFRPALIEALLDLIVRGQFADAQTLHTYYRFSRGPLPDALAAKLLASKSWLNHARDLAAPNADSKTPNAVMETALLIPDTMLPAFLDNIGPLSPHLTLAPRMFADFCKSLAETTPVAPLTQSR
jgi:hypothetical protein